MFTGHHSSGACLRHCLKEQPAESLGMEWDFRHSIILRYDQYRALGTTMEQYTDTGVQNQTSSNNLVRSFLGDSDIPEKSNLRISKGSGHRGSRIGQFGFF